MLLLHACMCSPQRPTSSCVLPWFRLCCGARLCSKARVEAVAWADEVRVAQAGGQCLVAELAALEMLYERASGHELYNLELSRKQVRGVMAADDPLMTANDH